MLSEAYPLALAFLVLVAAAAALFTALFVWYLTTAIVDEIGESVRDYRGMRTGERKRLKDIEIDKQFAEWLEEFEKPVGSLRVLSHA